MTNRTESWRQIVWAAGRDREANRLANEIAPWNGTRYMKGQSCRGVATNCVGFFVRVMEGLYGIPKWKIPPVADDAAFHHPPTAKEGLRLVFERFKDCVAESWDPSKHLADEFPKAVRPGDVLVTGPHGGGPGHVVIVGWRPNTLWQAASPTGVHMTGIEIPQHYLYRVFTTRKDTWVDVPR